MNADIYVVNGEGLNTVTFWCNIWSVVGRKEHIISLKNRKLINLQPTAIAKKQKSAEKWHPSKNIEILYISFKQTENDKQGKK